MNASTRKRAKLCREFALDKKAIDPVILDLSKIQGPALCFVICSGQSDPHLKAIAGGIEEGMREQEGIKPAARDGGSSSQWIVLDYGDVLVHVMHESKRGFYELENLWGDVPKVR
jgi:ribosome-associated protein